MNQVPTSSAGSGFSGVAGTVAVGVAPGIWVMVGLGVVVGVGVTFMLLCLALLFWLYCDHDNDTHFTHDLWPLA